MLEGKLIGVCGRWTSPEDAASDDDIPELETVTHLTLDEDWDDHMPELVTENHGTLDEDWDVTVQTRFKAPEQ